MYRLRSFIMSPSSFGSGPAYTLPIAMLGVPFAFASGYGEAGLTEPHKGSPVLQKPFREADLRRVLWSRFQLGADRGLAVTVTSFSFRHGLPRESDLVFDVRFMRNPYYVEGLRELSKPFGTTIEIEGSVGIIRVRP